jgi:hypothetical protein
MRERIAVVLGLLAITAPITAVTASDDCLEPVGRWPYGVSNDVAAEGNRAVLANGAVLQVLDLTVPSAPSIIGEVDLSHEISAVALSGTHAYAVAKSSLHVIDLDGPKPTVVGVLDGVAASGIEVSDGFAYLISSRLLIVDIANPTAPALRGQIVWENPVHRDVRVESGYAYIIDQKVGLRVVEVSDPDSPIEVTYLDLGASTNAERIDVASGYAYVVGWTWVAGTGDVFQLFVIDLTDPTTPEIVTSPTIASSRDIVVRQGVASLVGFSWFRTYDVTDPQTPVSLGNSQLSSDFDSRQARMVAIDGYVLVTRDHIGLTVIDLSDPAVPAPIAGMDVPALIEDANFGNGLLVIGAHARGVRVVDVSDQAGPIELGFTPMSPSPWIGSDVWSTAVVGETAYAAGDFPAGLVALDMSDPSTPVALGNAPWVVGTWLTIADERAYALDQSHGGLSVVDLSSPSEPVLVGELDLGGEPFETWEWPVVIGDHLVIRDTHPYDDDSLVIVDVGDPTNPVQIAQFDLWADYPGSGLAALGTWLLVPDVLIVNSPGIDTVSVDPVVRVFDFSDPTAPVEVAPYFSTGQLIGAIGVAGSVAYLATWDSKPDSPYAIEAVNFANPREPAFLGLVPHTGDAKRLTFSPDEVFVAHRKTGFETFALCQDPLFDDGFETGDTTMWSVTLH